MMRLPHMQGYLTYSKNVNSKTFQGKNAKQLYPYPVSSLKSVLIGYSGVTLST